ncbi:HDOD domain-containing protein [Chitinibacter sp. S2-10]|uniref:HDOD domain-containing protein n=1 Tax=Chitinibacter sp. S2-10 TaxID=3373597 RepID=UPI00397783BD
MLNQPFTELQQWIDYLSAQPLPILAHTHEAMRDYRSRIDDIGLHEIGQLIRHDPLLTLNVLRYLETNRKSSQLTDVTTIERVLLMIGVSGFFRLFGALPNLEEQGQKVMIDGAHRTCSRAFLAGRIAEMLSEYRRDIDPNEVMTAALLHDTAEILLWLSIPLQMLDMQLKLQSDPTLRSKDVQRQLLGCKINQIQQGLVIKWALPRTLLHLMDDGFAEEPRVYIVNLAVGMARHLESGWDSPYFLDDLKNCAAMFNREFDEMYARIRHVALDAARHWYWYGVEPAAARLINAD